MNVINKYQLQSNITTKKLVISVALGEINCFLKITIKFSSNVETFNSLSKMPENILIIQAVGRLRQSILLNLSQVEVSTTIFIHLNKDGLDKLISKHDLILIVFNPRTQ